MEDNKKRYIVSCRVNVEVEVDAEATDAASRKELKDYVLTQAKEKLGHVNKEAVQYTILNDPTMLCE